VQLVYATKTYNRIIGSSELTQIMSDRLYAVFLKSGDLQENAEHIMDAMGMCHHNCFHRPSVCPPLCLSLLQLLTVNINLTLYLYISIFVSLSVCLSLSINFPPNGSFASVSDYSVLLIALNIFAYLWVTVTICQFL